MGSTGSYARFGPCVGKPDASTLTPNARRSSPFFPSSHTPLSTFRPLPSLLLSSPLLSSPLAAPRFMLRGALVPLRLRALLTPFSRPRAVLAPLHPRRPLLVLSRPFRASPRCPRLLALLAPAPVSRAPRTRAPSSCPPRACAPSSRPPHAFAPSRSSAPASSCQCPGCIVVFLPSIFHCFYHNDYPSPFGDLAIDLLCLGFR
ncbi:hypothetical protein EVG20_g2783 [Dentipellis fragilis]|uniref:Uncharacterized protein n=1 Tax=Dentipellis fragilis TaxID=205917 RepID=A0A4Y9Z6Z4_9AGAM|nr:hypothetical protein EVG20_g2783 [Dentipellis fragilis]